MGPATEDAGRARPATKARAHPAKRHPATAGQARADPATEHPAKAHPATGNPAVERPDNVHRDRAHPTKARPDMRPDNVHPDKVHPGSPAKVVPARSRRIGRGPKAAGPASPASPVRVRPGRRRGATRTGKPAASGIGGSRRRARPGRPPAPGLDLDLGRDARTPRSSAAVPRAAPLANRTRDRIGPATDARTRRGSGTRSRVPGPRPGAPACPVRLPKTRDTARDTAKLKATGRRRDAQVRHTPDKGPGRGTGRDSSTAGTPRAEPPAATRSGNRTHRARRTRRAFRCPPWRRRRWSTCPPPAGRRRPRRRCWTVRRTSRAAASRPAVRPAGS
ncbi:hypothetical protein GCM10010182_09520 [Actinomadura cremea]|nr:hypothetical protein GCM10010182_09520 [Actinomadura cremea]